MLKSRWGLGFSGGICRRGISFAFSVAFAVFAMVVVAVVATVAGGFGAVGGGFAEVDRDGDFVDVLFDEGFDAMEFALFFLADESDGNAVCIGTGGASDAMDVVFRVVGHVVVDDGARRS